MLAVAVGLSLLAAWAPGAETGIKKGPRPPDRVGERLELPFPPPAGARPAAPRPGAEPALPLQVLLHQPEGIDQEPTAVSVTFNQPMVPVGALEEIRKLPTPLELEPRLPGSFHWAGSTTLTFRPEGRLPRATRFEVRVPRGARALSGASLAEDFAFAFETPRPRVVGVRPHDGQDHLPLEPGLVLTFDQPVAAERAFGHARLVDEAGAQVPLAPLPRERWKPELGLEGDAAERSAALRPERPLRPAAAYRLEVEPGLVGLGGPLPMTQAFSSSFRTYGPLAVVGLLCGWSQDARECEVGEELRLAFSNELAERDPAGFVRVEPAVPGLRLEREGSYVALRGAFAAGVAYRVTVKAGLGDAFGQRLATPWTGRMRLVHRAPVFEVLTEGVALLERQGRLELPLLLLNVRAVQVEAYRFPEAALPAFLGLEGQLGDAEDLDRELAAHRGLRVAGWRDAPRTAWDREEVRGLPLRRLVAAHGSGAYLLRLTPRGERGASLEPRAVMLQVSDLGLTARYDSERVVVLATSISSGRPRAGVRLRLRPGQGLPELGAVTGGDGLAVLTGAPAERASSSLLLSARAGRDEGFVVLGSRGDDDRWSSLSWGRPPRAEAVRLFLFPDRDLFRPGEEVSVFGLARRYAAERFPRPGPLPPDQQAYRWVARSARGREVARGEGRLEEQGSLRLAFRLPADVDLGRLSLEVTLPAAERQGGRAGLSLQVEEYRAPEHEVLVELGPAGALAGQALTAKVQGRYLFGAPMRGAEARWQLFADPARFSAPGQEGFHFGSAPEPWWWWRGERMHEHFRERRHPIQQGQGPLDGQGALAPALSPPRASGPDPLGLTLEAQVVDLSRQSVAGRAHLLLHPAERYAGLRPERVFLEVGQPLRVELVLVDVAGRAQAGAPLELRAARRDRARGEDEPLAEPCRVTSAAHPVACSLALARPGSWRLEASAQDPGGRRVQSAQWVEVLGPGGGERDTRASRLDLVADREGYQPGQTASVLLRAPFPEGVVLVTVEREGILAHHLLELERHVARLEVELGEEHLPRLHVAATAVEARPPAGKWRGPPGWAAGTLALEVSREPRRLRVTLAPAREEARPGQRLPLEVAVADAAGRPVPARVGLAVVDEAVLSMTGFAAPDPLPFFHFPREAGASLAEGLRRLVPDLSSLSPEQRRDAAKEKMARSGAAPEMLAGEESAGPGGAPAAVRGRFASTAWAGWVSTGADGRAALEVPLPDNLTRFRLSAVAADGGERFGQAQAAVRVSKPLQLRPALPRFVNTGDAFQLGALVDHRGAEAGEARVRLEVEGLELLGPAEAGVRLEPGRAGAVSFRVRAPRPGRARVRLFARLGGEQDAVEVGLPVWVPATAETFATYGTTQGSVSQPVRPPADALAGFGGLEIQLASSALQGLEDAVRYLVEYPYECVEQTASRALPILALGDLLEAFRLGGLETRELQQGLARRAVARLLAAQRGDGGFGSFGGAGESRADLSAYVLLVLDQARAAKLDVPAEALERVAGFLRDWLRAHRELPSASQDAWRRRWLLDQHAQALFALSGGHGQVLEEARWLLPLAGELDVFARAMLAVVFQRAEPQGPEVKALWREVLNRAEQTPAAARFVESHSLALRVLMHSSSRTDAIVLLAALEIEPGNPLVPKIVRGLLDARVRGRWETTQANAWALLALSRYFRAYEAEPTEFTARMWLGQGYLGQADFSRRSLVEQRLEVPMAALQAAGPGDLVLAKDGPGRLYYRVGMRYAPRGLALPAAEEGFTVQRTYEPIEAPGDVVRRPDGVWQVKAGSYVRVHLKVVAPDRRFYAVVDDPLPAGLELVNLAFKTSAQGALEDGGDPGWYGAWISWLFQHRELRDERSLHFADELWPGVYDVTVIARATTPGVYLVPPARAEEMYRPEVFGRSASDRLEVR